MLASCVPTVIFGNDFALPRLDGRGLSASEAVTSEAIESVLRLPRRVTALSERADEGRKEELRLPPIGGDCLEIEERAFRAGSIRTAFSIHISWVYELKLFWLVIRLGRSSKIIEVHTLGQFSWHLYTARETTWLWNLYLFLVLALGRTPGCAAHRGRFPCPQLREANFNIEL